MAGDHRTPTRPGPATSTAALVARLAGAAHPVRRIWSPSARFAFWLAVELAVLIAATLTLGLRADITSRLGQASFAGELLLLLGTVGVGLGSAALALLAAVPGREPARALAVGACTVVFAGLGVAFAVEPSLGHGLSAMIAKGWPCAVKTVAIAALPWLVLLTAVRRGATLVPGLAGLLAGIATLCLAALAVRATCPLDERWHLLGFHLAPLALGAVLSLALGTTWLVRWRRGG